MIFPDDLKYSKEHTAELESLLSAEQYKPGINP